MNHDLISIDQGRRLTNNVSVLGETPETDPTASGMRYQVSSPPPDSCSIRADSSVVGELEHPYQHPCAVASVSGMPDDSHKMWCRIASPAPDVVAARWSGRPPKSPDRTPIATVSRTGVAAARRSSSPRVPRLADLPFGP